MAKKNKKKNKVKEEIRIYFRDGKKDITAISCNFNDKKKKK